MGSIDFSFKNVICAVCSDHQFIILMRNRILFFFYFIFYLFVALDGWFWSVVFRINMCTVRPYRAVIACMCASVMIDRLMQLMHASRAVHASHAE